MQFVYSFVYAVYVCNIGLHLPHIFLIHNKCIQFCKPMFHEHLFSSHTFQSLPYEKKTFNLLYKFDSSHYQFSL